MCGKNPDNPKDFGKFDGFLRTWFSNELKNKVPIYVTTCVPVSLVKLLIGKTAQTKLFLAKPRAFNTKCSFSSVKFEEDIRF